MVTTTYQFDEDMPTHDALGTDLRRVAAMRAAGYSDWLMARSLGTTTQHIRYAIAVLTNDTDGCPSPEEIEAACREIQAGWTPEQAVAARRGEARLSSTVVRGDTGDATARRAARVAEHWQEYRQRKLTDGDIPVREVERDGVIRWEVRVHFLRRGMKRIYDTREEAVAAGLEWLRGQQHRMEAMEADAQCVGT